MTICTHEGRILFGRVVDGEIAVNEFGDIVREERFRTARLRPYVELYADEFVVMPNDIHGIIWITDRVGARSPPCPYHRTIWPAVFGFRPHHRLCLT